MTSLHRITSADPHVVNRSRSRLHRFECEQMGLAQVVDVHVIANARSVSRRVIVPEHRHLRTFAESDLQQDGYQVGLGMMVLA